MQDIIVLWRWLWLALFNNLCQSQGCHSLAGRPPRFAAFPDRPLRLGEERGALTVEDGLWLPRSMFGKHLIASCVLDGGNWLGVSERRLNQEESRCKRPRVLNLGPLSWCSAHIVHKVDGECVMSWIRCTVWIYTRVKARHWYCWEGWRSSDHQLHSQFWHRPECREIKHNTHFKLFQSVIVASCVKETVHETLLFVWLEGLQHEDQGPDRLIKSTREFPDGFWATVH